MAAQTLVERKFEASRQLVDQLLAQQSPLLAAYWEFRDEVDQWTLKLVPVSHDAKGELLKDAVDLLVQNPYRAIFSLADTSIDGYQIDRAKALGDYIRIEPYVGRRIDTTFTGGQFFESVIPVYLRPDLMTHLPAA